MSLKSLIFGKSNSPGYTSEANEWRLFLHDEINETLDCCNSPNCYIESCDLPDTTMSYSAVCQNCGNEFDGAIVTNIYVEMQMEEQDRE